MPELLYWQPVREIYPLVLRPAQHQQRSRFSRAGSTHQFEDITGYVNFYEFTTNKTGVENLTGNFKTTPWSVEVGGLVNNPGIYDLTG